jgi:hypothetical protein
VNRQAVGCYPGSFDPPTVAHLAVAEAALEQGRLVRVELVISRGALGKEHLDEASVIARVEALRALAATRPWLAVRVTAAQLVADVAAGFDAVVLGADKWRQVVDPVWYGGNPAARDAAVARLPYALLAPRGDDSLDPLPLPLPPAGAQVLHLDPVHRNVSSTAVRGGAQTGSSSASSPSQA